jgi:hypothetical protein
MYGDGTRSISNAPTASLQLNSKKTSPFSNKNSPFSMFL